MALVTFSEGKLPSGKKVLVATAEEGTIVLGTPTEGDKLFYQIEKELAAKEAAKTTFKWPWQK